MMSVLLAVVVAVAAFSRPHAEALAVMPPSAAKADLINSLNASWTPANYSGRFRYSADYRYLFGVLPADEKLPELVEDANRDDEDVPDSFDARHQWSNCPSIQEIRDQSNCGSCWAFATAEAISDRTCIASNGTVTEDLSAQDILSCCNNCGDGCEGGYPSKAWEFWVKEGVCTGGLHNGTGCKPYTIPPRHHGEPYRFTPVCKWKCKKHGMSYMSSKRYGRFAYSITTEKRIQKEIMQRGPVGASFTVYSDFPSYKSGVYQAHSRDVLSGHAVKILGWGSENAVPYWLCANSWNTEWGEDGFFRILRGSNHCGIEANVIGGQPQL